MKIETKKFRILCFKAIKNDNSNLDNAIELYGGLTNPLVPKELHCYHVEFWESDENNQFIDSKGNFTGICTTSTRHFDKNGRRGVLCRPSNQVIKDSKRLFYWEGEMLSGICLKKINERIQWEYDNNQGYDNSCIVSFFWPWRFHDKNKWICSEIIIAICLEIAKSITLFSQDNTNKVFQNIFKNKYYNFNYRNYNSLPQGPIWSPTRFNGKLYKAGAKFYNLKNNSLIII